MYESNQSTKATTTNIYTFKVLSIFCDYYVQRVKTFQNGCSLELFNKIKSIVIFFTQTLEVLI
ncbi:hypothetical protein Bhyg_14837, partial [Pseudolycoriella hygida]